MDRQASCNPLDFVSELFYQWRFCDIIHRRFMKVQKHTGKKTGRFFCFALITTLSECSLELNVCSCLLLPLISSLMLLSKPLLRINVGY